MAPPKQQQHTRPSSSPTSLSTQSTALINSYKNCYTQGKQSITKALELDEALFANSRVDKFQLVERAKEVLKFYLDGGEIIKAILAQGNEKLSR